jgi:serine/threonine protein kinase
VAVKVLRPELAAALRPERFLREIEIAAGLTHPHLLPVHDSGDAKGFLYFVMPCVEGESLRDRLNREKQLPVEDALQIAREVADALDSAHRHDVIHRDIKPENILLEEGHAVVADFGIARAVDVAGGSKLTGTGIALGTPEYMSPEQAAGVSRRRDDGSEETRGRPRGAGVETDTSEGWGIGDEAGDSRRYSRKKGVGDELERLKEVSRLVSVGMGRWIRTLKEECCLYLHDFQTLEEARHVIGEFIEAYNREWLIERHGHRTPAEVRQALARNAA